MYQATRDATMNTNIIIPLNNLEKEILSDKAIKFATLLHETFNPTRLELLESRKIRQSEIDSGNMPDFLTETKPIRQGDWKINPIPNNCLVSSRLRFIH